MGERTLLSLKILEEEADVAPPTVSLWGNSDRNELQLDANNDSSAHI